MQRLDLVHPGEGQLIVGPVALGDDRDLVLAGALERPVVIGGDVLANRERVGPGVDDAFEEGHASSTLPLRLEIRWLLHTQQNDTRLARPLPTAIPRGVPEP